VRRRVLEAGRRHLEALLERWPRSPLADFVHAAFARSYGRRFADYREQRVREPDCARALEHLRRVAEDRLPEYIRLQNALTRARCAIRDGDRDAALAHIKRAKAIGRNRPEYRGVMPRNDELERYVTTGGRDQ
jgi:hypothetical protein